LSFEEEYNEDGTLLQHEIAHGDFNGDGISDIALIGRNRCGIHRPWDAGIPKVLAHCYRLDKACRIIDVEETAGVDEKADIVIDSSAFTSVTNVGNQNGDIGAQSRWRISHLLDGQTMYLMYGDASWQVWSQADASVQ
jgi:hypothetical protein